jgi:CheY-like chemotaxis protein
MTTEPCILVIDDDIDFIESLSSFLTAHGCRVLTAAAGREGLTVARQHRPDLILVDIIMDERTEGFFTLQEMRRTPELRAVPIFVVSSLYTVEPDFGIPPDRAWLGHDAFFRKPVDMPALLAEITRVLGARGAPAGRPERQVEP